MTCDFCRSKPVTKLHVEFVDTFMGKSDVYFLCKECRKHFYDDSLYKVVSEEPCTTCSYCYEVDRHTEYCGAKTEE